MHAYVTVWGETVSPTLQSPARVRYSCPLRIVCPQVYKRGNRGGLPGASLDLDEAKLFELIQRSALLHPSYPHLRQHGIGQSNGPATRTPMFIDQEKRHPINCSVSCRFKPIYPHPRKADEFSLPFFLPRFGCTTTRHIPGIGRIDPQRVYIELISIGGHCHATACRCLAIRSCTRFHITSPRGSM
jgi:hypothetical protein